MAKILHISKFYYPYFGGIEDVAQTIVQELKPYHEQKVICFNSKNQTEYSEVDGIEVVRAAKIGDISSQPISISYLKSLKKIICDFEPDFIHIHLPNPLIVYLLLKIDIQNIKLVVHWHADILGHSFFYNIYRKWEKKILYKCHKIIATSEIYRKGSTQLQNLEYKTIILPNTVNETKFETIDKNIIAGIKEKFGNKKILLFIGRHVSYKGIDYLIEAEKFIQQDCVILIAGSGPETKKLKTLAKKSDRILFIGNISNSELSNYLHASDVFVFPSINRREAFGVALLEAIYCGLPAVSFNIEGSGTKWVNKNGSTGFVVENYNVEQFANAIDNLLENNELRKTFSENAIAWAKKKFLRNQIVDILQNVYNGQAKTPDPNKINVSIVLFNNSFVKVKNLIEVLRSNKKIASIFLIDNSPNSDNRYSQLDATYIFNNKNIGYGRGHNIAIKQSLINRNAAYHLVMNADIILESSIFDKISDFLNQNEDIGALMPKVYYPNGKIQYLCRLLPSPIDLLGRRFLPRALMKKRVAKLEMRNTDYKHILNVPHISGCFMFLRSKILEKSGLFDSRYFLYMEDLDLTRRIMRHGKTIFFPKIEIVHEHKQGSYKSIKPLVFHIYSAIKYFNKWGWFSDQKRTKINRETTEQVATAKHHEIGN